MSSYMLLLYLSSYTNSRSQIFHPNCTPKLSCGHIRHRHLTGFCAALKGVRSSCFPPLGTHIPSAVTWDCGEPTDEAPLAQGRRGSQGRWKQRQQQQGAPRGGGGQPAARAGLCGWQREQEAAHCPHAHPGAVTSGERNCPISSEKQQKASCTRRFSFFNRMYLYPWEHSSHAAPSRAGQPAPSPQTARRRQMFLKAFFPR